LLIGRWLMLIRYSHTHRFQIAWIRELVMQVLIYGWGVYALSFLELH